MYKATLVVKDDNKAGLFDTDGLPVGRGKRHEGLQSGGRGRMPALFHRVPGADVRHGRRGICHMGRVRDGARVLSAVRRTDRWEMICRLSHVVHRILAGIDGVEPSFQRRVMVHGFLGHVPYPRRVDGLAGRGHDPQHVRPVESSIVAGHVEHESGIPRLQCRETGSDRRFHCLVVSAVLREGWHAQRHGISGLAITFDRDDAAGRPSRVRQHDRANLPSGSVTGHAAGVIILVEPGEHGTGLLELTCGFLERFVGLFDLHICGSESDEGEDERKDGQQDAELTTVAGYLLREIAFEQCLFRLVPHAVIRAADAVQPFLFRQFPGVLPLFGGQRGIVPGVFLFLFFFIHKPIL